MKKLVFLFIAALLIIPFAKADKYKILTLNTSSIKIGGKYKVQGDEFKDKQIIEWSDENQAFKAMNLKTKQITLFTAKELKAYDSETIKKFIYVKTVALSKRGGIDSSFSGTFYLMDSLIIKSPIQLYEGEFIFYTYTHNNIEIKKPFTIDKNSNLVLTAAELAEMHVEKEIELTLPVYLYDNKGKSILISDNFIVVIIPEELE